MFVENMCVYPESTMHFNDLFIPQKYRILTCIRLQISLHFITVAHVNVNAAITV